MEKSHCKGVFCNAEDADKNIRYDEMLWKPKNVANDREPDQEIAGTNACRFIRAAWKHRDYVLHELLPEFELITYR